MAEVTFKEANRRYRRLFWPAIGVYTAICFGGPLLFKTMGDPPAWFVALVAIATAAPIVAVFLLIGRLLRETDEYTRKIQTEALLAGGAVTLSLVVAWSFLELYGLAPAVDGFPAMMMVGPAFFLFYGLAFCARRLRGSTADA